MGFPPEPASKYQPRPLLQGFGAVPPLVTDIDLYGRQVLVRRVLGNRLLAPPKATASCHTQPDLCCWWLRQTSPKPRPAPKNRTAE